MLGKSLYAYLFCLGKDYQKQRIILLWVLSKAVELTKAFEKYTQFLSFLSYKYDIKFDDLNSDLRDFCEGKKENLSLLHLGIL